MLAGVAAAAGGAGAEVFDAPAFFAGAAFGARGDVRADFAEVAFLPLRVFAQRARCAAAIFARAPALSVRFFARFTGLPVPGCLVAGSAVVSRAAFFAALLDFAQRALCAAAIFSRASALIVHLLVLRAPDGRAGFRPSMAVVPVRSAFACWSRVISASISTTMSSLFMNPPLMRIPPALARKRRCPL